MNEPKTTNSDEIPTLDSNELARKVSQWGTIVGVVLVLLGIASLMLPSLTALAIETWLALMFLLVGIGLFVQTFQNRAHSSVVYEVVWGILYLAGGLFLLLVPKSGIITLALILGVVFIFDGVGKIVLASRAYFDQRKIWWTIDGVIAILLGGIILWNWPGDSVWIIGVLVGIRLLVTGIVTLMVANMFRSGS